MNDVELEAFVNQDGDRAYRTEDGYSVERVEGRSPWAVNGPDMFRTAYCRNLARVRDVIAMARRGELSAKAVIG